MEPDAAQSLLVCLYPTPSVCSGGVREVQISDRGCGVVDSGADITIMSKAIEASCSSSQVR